MFELKLEGAITRKLKYGEGRVRNYETPEVITGGTVMEQVGFVVKPETYRKIAQRTGDVEGYCSRCGKVRRYSPEQLEKLMRKWPTCRNCNLKISVRLAPEGI